MSQIWVPGRGSPSRRSFLSAAMLSGASLAGASLLGGCSDASTSSVVPVQLWHLFTGGDGGVFQAMMDTVDSQNPDIELRDRKSVV